MYALLKSHATGSMTGHEAAEQQATPALAGTGISAGLRQKLLYMHHSSFDWQRGGLKTPIKFLDRDSIEYSLTQAALQDKNEECMARLSLVKGMGLIDSEHGGIYQFATQNCWHENHYGKTMAAQAGCLRIYALAFALLGEYAFLATTRNIRAYLQDTLLTNDGVFRSVPQHPVINIDRHSPGRRAACEMFDTRDNGWAIEALATCHEFTGDPSSLEMATRAATWVLAERRLANGGFKAAAGRRQGLRLGDNLAMARALLQLYRVTGARHYLQHAVDVTDFICARFVHAAGGFCSTPATPDTLPQLDENICLGRFLNLMHYYTDNLDYLEMARHGLRYLAIPGVATSRMEEAGILLLDQELATTPLKISVTALLDDPDTACLWQRALRTFGWYKVIHRCRIQDNAERA